MSRIRLVEMDEVEEDIQQMIKQVDELICTMKKMVYPKLWHLVPFSRGTLGFLISTIFQCCQSEFEPVDYL